MMNKIVAYVLETLSTSSHSTWMPATCLQWWS